MLIVCPNCATPYQVENSEIGEGRSVRCVRCKAVWFTAAPAAEPGAAGDPAGDKAVAAFQMELGAAQAAAAQQPPTGNAEAGDAADRPPPETAGDPAPEPSAEESAGADAQAATAAAPDAAAEAPADPAAALSEVSVPVEDAPPLVPADDESGAAATEQAAIDGGHDNIESAAARRRARARARAHRTGTRSRLPAVILALIAVCAALVGWRRDVVRHVPQLASFYASIGLPVNLRGLAFADVKVARVIHDGVPVLAVEGVIESVASTPVEVPRLRFALLNAAGAEVYSWTALPAQRVLEPGKTLPFRSRLASPPQEGRDMQVRFFTRRDAVAGLR